MVQYKPGSSQYKRVRPFLLLLTCGVSFSFLGCPQHPKIRTASFPCGHQDVQLSDQTGVDKKNVFVCDGDTITWDPTGHRPFKVEFTQESPFGNPQLTFDENNKTTPPMPKTAGACFKYKITLDHDPNRSFDPQIIVMGGNP
ncbi:MAG TPA: hypothetical protein VF860_03185 [Candidatus Acidoferrales bacterium]